jgi:hypothetical protein
MQPKVGDQCPDAKVDSSTEPGGNNDIVLIHGRSPDGKGLSVIRHRNDQLEQGLVMPLEQGKPIHGEVVTLRPRPEFPLLCDVRVECSRPSGEPQDNARPVGKGPRQVATEQYRTNWDRIFDRTRGNLN